MVNMNMKNKRGALEMTTAKLIKGLIAIGILILLVFIAAIMYFKGDEVLKFFDNLIRWFR